MWINANHAMYFRRLIAAEMDIFTKVKYDVEQLSNHLSAQTKQLLFPLHFQKNLLIIRPIVNNLRASIAKYSRRMATKIFTLHRRI